MLKALMGGGRSSSDVRDSSRSKGGSRRKTSSKSSASSTVSRKSSRGDDRGRGLGDLSAYPSSSSRSMRYASSAAGDSVASSYATAQPNFSEESERIIIERVPKRRDSDRDRRDDPYPDNRDRDWKKDSGRRDVDDSYRPEQQRTHSGDPYFPPMATGGVPFSAPGAPYTPIPTTQGPSQSPFPATSMSSPPGIPAVCDPHVQQQFPGQFPTSFAEPYRPPNPAGEAADYYNDQGQSVTEQPGVRPKPPLVIPNSQAHLMTASPSSNPPPEPSSMGQVGAAASYYDGDVGVHIQTSEQPSAPQPPKPSKPSHTAAETAGILGTAAATYGIGNSFSNNVVTESPTTYAPAASSNFQKPPLPPLPPPPPQAQAQAQSQSQSHSMGAAVGVAAAGAAAGYMLGHTHHSSSSGDHTSQYTMQNYDEVSQHGQGFPATSGYSPVGNPALHEAGAAGTAAAAAAGYAASPLHPHHAAVHHGAPFPSGGLAFQQRQRGPLDKFLDFWRDYEGVGMFEDYTETIGVCKYCFEPGTTSRDAPRVHHYKARRRSSDRTSDDSRVQKATRYASSEDESRRRKSSKKSWLLPGILGGYAVKSLFENKDFDDTYSIRSGQSVSVSHDSEGTSASARRSQTSRGVYRRPHRSRSRERMGRSDYPDPAVTKYDRSQKGARSRSRSSSRPRHHDLRDAAIGAAVGTAVMTVQSHHRTDSPNRSPRRARSRKLSSSESSFMEITRPDEQSRGGFGSFFTAPSENRKSRRRRRSRSIFSFTNSSSSSLDVDLAFGKGFTKKLKGKSKKRSPRREKKEHDVDARLLALGATATALAASSHQRDRRPGAILAGQGSRSGRSDYTASVSNDDGWEDMESEDQASSVSSALAFGASGRFGSDDSHSSDSSSRSGWGWGWGGKNENKTKKKRKRRKRRPSPSENHFPAGAAVAAGALGTAALASAYHRDHKASSQAGSSSAMNLQQVAPIPTSDPSRYDAIPESSFPVQPPLVRPGPIPLQQPQPMMPVSQAVYTTQGGPIGSCSAPTIPPAFRSPFESYESQVREVNRGQWNIRNSAYPERRETGPEITRRHQRSDSTPLFHTEPLEGAPGLGLKRRSTTKDQPSVQFDLTKEQEDKERRTVRLEGLKREPEREDWIQLIDKENAVDPRDPRYGSQRYSERDYDRPIAMEHDTREDASRSSSWAGAVAAGTIGAAAAATVLSRKSSDDDASEMSERRHSERRAKRRQERRSVTGSQSTFSDLSEKIQKIEVIEDPDSTTSPSEHVKTSAFRSVSRKKSPVHEDYAEFFFPEKLRHSPDHSSSRGSPTMPTIIEIEPASESLRKKQPEEPQPDPLDGPHYAGGRLPWPVPSLNVIEPTPPHSVNGSVKDASSPIVAPSDPHPVEEKPERPTTGSRVSWGEHETHEYEVPSTSSEHDSVDLEQRQHDHDYEATAKGTPGYTYVTPSSSAPDGFIEDVDFAATVAAATQAAGFDPSIVTDDPTFYERTSRPGSEVRDSSMSPTTREPYPPALVHGLVRSDMETTETGTAQFFEDRPVYADPESSLPKDQVEDTPGFEIPTHGAGPVMEEIEHTVVKSGSKEAPCEIQEPRDFHEKAISDDLPEESESTPEELFSMPGGFDVEEPSKRSQRKRDSSIPKDGSHSTAGELETQEKPRDIANIDLNDVTGSNIAEDDSTDKKRRRKRRSSSVTSSRVNAGDAGEKRRSTDDNDNDTKSGGFLLNSIFGSRVSEPVESRRLSETLVSREVQSEIGPQTSEEFGRPQKEKSSRHRSSSGAESLDNDSRSYDGGALDYEDSLTANKENINLESYKSSRRRREERRRQKETDGLGVTTEFDKDRRATRDSDGEESFLVEGPEMPRRDDDDDYNGASGRYFPADTETKGLGLALAQRPRSHSASPPVSEKLSDEPVPRSHSRSASPDAALVQGEDDGQRSRRSSVLRSTDSPTAVPLQFRRPPTSPRMQRSPSASSPTAVPPTSPTQGRSRRPNSTEFKNSREIRPLWLVERHGASKMEAGPDEPLPSLPPSKPSSASSSVEDLTTLRDQNAWELPEFSHQIHGAADEYYAQDDVAGSQQGTPTRATFSQSHMHVPHLSRKAELGYEFHSPSELLQDPIASAELPPSPTLDILPSVEGSAVGVRDDDNGIKRDLETLPPLPDPRPSTPEDKIIRLSDTETTPTQEKMGLAPAADMPGLNQGPGFAGIVDAAVAHVPADPPYPERDILEKYQPDHVEEDETARAVTGDDMPALTDVPALTSALEDKEQHTRSFESTTPRGFASIVDAAVAAEKEVTPGEPAVPGDLPGDESKADVFVDTLEAGKDSEAELPRFETPVIPAVAEEVSEEVAKYDAEPITETTETVSEPTAKALDETTKSQPEKRVVEKAPEDSSKNTTKKNKKKKKKKGKSLDLDEQDQAPSTEIPEPEAVPEAVPEATVETVQDPLVEQVSALGEGAAFEGESVPGEPTSEHTHALDQHLAAGMSSAIEPATATDDVLPILEEVSAPGEPSLLEKEPETGVLRTDDVPEPPESMKAAEPESGQPEETEEIPADSGLSKKAKKKKKRKSKAAAEEQPTAGLADESTDQPPADITSEIVEEPQEVARIDEPIESERSIQDPVNPPADQEGAVPAEPVSQQNALETTETPLAEESTGHSLEPTEFVEAVPRADEILQSTSDVLVTEEVAPEQLDQDIVLVDQETAVLAEPVSQENAHVNTEIPLAEESTGHSLKPTEFVEAVPRADEILQSTSDVLVTEEVAPEQLDQDIVLVDQETAVLAEPVSQENALVTTETLQSTSDVPVTEEVAPEELDKDMVLVGMPLEQELLQTEAPVEGGLTAPVVEESSPEGQQTAEALVEDLKEPTAETVSEASVTAPKQEAQDTSAPVDTQVPPESNEPKEEGEAAQVEPETTLSRKASKKKKKSKRKGTAEALPETELADTPQPETLEKSEPEIEPHPALGGEELVTKEHEQIVGDSKEIPTEAQKDEAIPEPVVETTNESQPTELAEKAEGIVLEEPEENQPKKKKKNKKNRKSLNLSESQPESEPEIKPEELPQDTTTQLPETSGEVPPTPADPEEQQQQKQQDAGTKEEAAEITNDDVVLENIQSESTLPVENIETNESEPHMSKHAEIEQPSGPNAGELPQTGKKSKKNKKKKQSISLTPDESSTADIVEASEASETPTPAALSTTDAVPDATVEEEPAALKEPSTHLVQEPAEEMSVEKELPAETTSEVPDDQATSGSATQMSAAQKKKAKKDKKKKRQSMLAEETEASEPAKETALTYPPTVEGPTPQDPEVAKSVEVDQPEFVEIIAEEQSTPEQRTEEPIPEQPTEEDIKSEEPVRDETVTTEIVEPIQEEPKEVEDLSAQTNAIPSTDEPSTAIAAQVQETVQDEVPAPVAEPTPVAEQPSEPVTDIIQGLEGEEQTREIVAQAGIQQSDDQPKDETTVEAEVAQDSTMVEPKEEKETSDDAQVSAEATPETPVKEEPQPALSKKEKKKKKKKRQSVSAEGDQAGPAAEEAPAEPTPSNPQETGENLTEESSVTGLEAAHDEVKSSAKGEPQELGKDTVTQETEVLPGAPAQEEVQLITPEEQTVTEEPVPQEDKVPDPVKDIDTKKDPVSEEPVTDPMESQEQDTQPKEEPQVASSKKKEKKKKKKKGQSISLDDSQPTTPTIEEPTPEQPSGEITEAVVTTEPEETPIQNQDPAPEPSGSKTPAEETQELEVQEDLPPAEEVQTATSKKKAKKEKKKRKSVVFASEEPSEKSAEASESAVTEPVEASGSEAIESPAGPEPATKQPDREIPKELAHEDAATKPEELQDLQTLEETSQEPSASAKLDESNVIDEPKKDEEALTEGMVDPVANVPGDFPGTIEEPVSTEAFPEEPKDGHNAAELKEVSQETEESAEPEATSEPLATEPSSPTEQTTENVEPESGSSKSKKKKKKRKTLEAIGDVPITAPEPSDSKLQDETQAQVVEPTTSNVKETEPEEPMQEQASEKQEDDNEAKSSKAKRKAKKDKKRQSNIQALEEDAALNAASEDKPQDPLSPVETAPIEELSRDTIEEPMELPTGTAFAPAEDDGKENQSHDTGLHGDHDKDLTWTDNKVSSQVEQQQETPSTYPSQPEHESTEADPALVTVEQIEAPSVEADVAEDSQAPAAIELESSSDALKDLDEEILSDSIQDKQIDKTELPPDKEVGELGGEKETTDALPALDKPDAMEEAFVEEKIEEADAQTDKEIPPVCTESEPIDEDKKVGEIIPEPEIEVEATEKIEPSNEPNAETEEPEPSVLPRKLSKKQKKQQRQAQKAANLQEQAEEEIAASSEEPTIPTSLVDELSGPAASEVVEQPVVVAENVVQQVEAPVVGTTESAAVFEADTDKIEISEVPIESTAEKDEITTPAPPIPFEEPQLSNAVEISILAEPSQETPTPVQDDSEDLRPVTTKKKNKKNKKKAAIQEPQPSDTGAKIDPAAVSEQVRQHDAEEKVVELVEELKEAPLQSTEDKDLSKADNEITLEEPAVEEEISVPPATLEEEPSPSGSLSLKESKKNKKAKKQAKKQLEVIPAPPVTDIEADEVTTDIKPADVGEDASLHVVEAQQPQDEQASHIEAPDETCAPLETTMESDPLFEAPVLKGEEVMEEAEKKGVPEPQEQEQEQEVLGEPVDQAVQEKELEEAKDQDTQPAGPEIEQSVSRKLSKKEKRRLKKQAAEEGPIEEPQLEPEAPDEPDVLIPEPTAEESTVLDPKQAKEDDFSPPRKLSKKEKKKKRKGDTDVDLPQQKSVQDVENASEQSPEQEQEPPVIEAIRSAGDDDTWPQIDWEKGKLDATEQASEASLEAHLAPFVPEIPGYKESAIPEALMNRPDETSGYERGEYINQQNAEADKVLNTPAADIDQETSTKELDTTLDNAEVISHKQSKVSSIFPDLERALFRRPILNQVSEAVKDGAEEETMTQEAIRNSAIQVSEAPIATVEPRGAGYIPSPSLAQDDVFGITATTQELPEESTRGRQLERHTSNDKLYDVPKARKEGDSSIQIEEEGLFGREATHRPPHHEIPLGAPLSMHEPSSLPATEAEQREDNPIPSCELRRSPSIHGRHSPVRRAWSLEEDDETETTTQAGAERGMGSPSRTPLQTISEQEADDRVEKTNKMSGSGSMVQEHGTPRLEMKPEHILPRPETPVRKFTENALGRRAWPTSEGQQLSDQADEDWEAAVRKRGPRTLSPERGLPTEMLKTPETDKPVLRPSSSGSNHSQPLRRIAHSTSGDLRAAALAAAGVIASQAPAGEHQSRPNTPQPPSRSPTDLDVEQIASSSSYDPVTDKGKRPIRNMTDVYEGWGETPSSPRSPSRPPSIRHRRSMQHLQELEFRLDQLISENRALSAARDAAEGKLRNASLARRKSDHALNSRDADLRDRESELEQLKKSVEWFQNEVTRLTEENKGLSTTNAGLIAAHAVEIQDTRQTSSRELEELRSQNERLSSDLHGRIKQEIETALAQKNTELRRLREELESARDKVKELQQQIAASMQDNVIAFRDEEYFSAASQKLCGHVQQWVLRFSKHSDHRRCRKLMELQDEKIADRFDNAILDGSDTDSYLSDRVRRRDVFMSVVMTMVWEFIFTRYLFGMDREQRQKLKSLEKQLIEVGPRNAIHRWRATTLSLLSKRPTFARQRESDTEAVALEIFDTLSRLLPPPSHVESQLLESLRKVLRVAVNLSIEMRTQLAEYIMVPPLQPEYNTNGDLARQVFFKASLMNERSGETTSNEELESQQAVVRVVLFPLVVKKGNDSGNGDDERIVCPAQVLVARPGKDRKLSTMASGDRMSLDASKSVHSIAPSSVMDMSNVI